MYGSLSTLMVFYIEAIWSIGPRNRSADGYQVWTVSCKWLRMSEMHR